MAISYDTLTNIWANASLKPIPVISNDGKLVLVSGQTNNGWFVGKVMADASPFYMMDCTSILLNGSEAIWATL